MTAAHAGGDTTAVLGHADRPVRWAVRDGRSVVLKRYLSADAVEVHDVMRALWASPFGQRRDGRAPGMPEPLALDAGDTVVMAGVAGAVVGARGALGASLVLAAPCADLLARLHESGVLVRRRRHAPAVLRSLERKAARLRDDPWALGAAWRATLDSLADVAPGHEDLVVSHGDFSPRNVLVDEHATVVLIDFDRLQLASRARDVSYWRAWCWATQALAGATPDWRITVPFVDAYLASSTSGARTALDAGERFHRAAALLRIAEGWSALRARPRVARAVVREAQRTIAEGVSGR